MLVNYSNVIDFITQFMYVMAPISVVFALVGKVTTWFVGFVSGDRRVTL